MAQLYFRYGTMNSGKSIEILKVAYNYEEQGKPVVLLTSRLDNRDGVGYISSRIGMKRREQKQFDLPIAPEGTPFQLKIWKLLQEIPYGTTITYGELARRSGDIKASRAVGMANSRNPLPILIPCHRVIGSGGKLTGYTGGLNIKIGLLQIEGALDLSLWPESPNY